MTAETTVCCSFCETQAPASETFQPYAAVNRCRDEAACSRRQLVRYDPSLILTMIDRPEPPPADAPPGARCDLCGSDVDLYRRSVEFRCRDRAACQRRQLLPDMSPAAEDFAEVGLPQLPGMFASQAASRVEVGAEPVPLSAQEISRHAVQDAAWRKR